MKIGDGMCWILCGILSNEIRREPQSSIDALELHSQSWKWKYLEVLMAGGGCLKYVSHGCQNGNRTQVIIYRHVPQPRQQVIEPMSLSLIFPSQVFFDRLIQ